MPKPKVVDNDAVPPVDFRDSGLDRAFLKKLAERQELYRPSSIDLTYKTLNRELATMLADAGCKSVLTPDWKVTFTPGASSRIDAKKLLQLGVSAAVIKKATVVTTYETVTVTAIKDTK